MFPLRYELDFYKSVLSSERMLHKDCERKGSVARRKSLVVIFKGLGAKTK
jgi:hypothetical protein